MGDYKEKYEMALEGVQEILSSGQDSIKMSQLALRLHGIFPELKESEDEKMVKAIIKALQSHSNSYNKLSSNGIQMEDAIAWLNRQVPTKISEEDEKIRKEIINYFQCQSRDEPSRKDTHNKWIAWIEKQKPTEWGDEEKRMLNGVIDSLEVLQDVSPKRMPIVDKEIQWLKSLKNGVQPQTKEWSEEDEEYLRRAITATKEVYPVTANWLKSLKIRLSMVKNC